MRLASYSDVISQQTNPHNRLVLNNVVTYQMLLFNIAVPQKTSYNITLFSKSQ